MKKSNNSVRVFVLLVSFFLVGVDPVSANGADSGAPLIIMGYTDNQGSPIVNGMTTASCRVVSDGIEVKFSGVVLVRDINDGPKGKFTEQTLYKNPETGAKAYRVFEKNDGKAYAIKTGPSGWPFGAVMLDGIEIGDDDYVASAPVRNGNVVFHIKISKENRERGGYFTFNGVHVGSDGTLSWFGTEGTKFTAYNVNGKPMIAVGTGCQEPSERARSLLSQYR